MPIYDYEYTDGPRKGERFEWFQNMSESPLTKHPKTGESIQRVVSAPMIGGKHSTAADKRKTSDTNLERLGFTKYVKDNKGYKKQFGGGPESMSP